MAAYPMPTTRRSAIWLFILLLLALAFLRSLAPERTEGAIRRLVAKRNQVQEEFDQREKKITEEKEELEREKAALERWKTELDARRQKLNQEEQETTHQHQPHDTDGDVNQQVDEFVGSIATGASENNEGIKNEEEDTNPEELPKDDQPNQQSVELSSPDLADEPAPTLSDEECPIIVAPEHTKAGLGTQIHHIWTSLSLTLAVRNACMVIPPVLADDGVGSFKPVPFHEVFDAHELARTGLRFVPLRTCQQHGVATVIDDAGKDTAIVKTFAQYVGESHPKLAAESTLVHGDSKGIRFLAHENIGGDPNLVGNYVRENLPEEKGRHCVGLGRMRATVEINPDVLKYFKPAAEVAAYVDEKFPLTNETLFVKLRWNKAHCDKARTEAGTVCINGDRTVPLLEYVSAIAHLAEVSGATRIYLAAPTHIPEDVSAYLASHLITVEPVLLDVGGDLFTAGVVERELAVRALRFVPDGGNWGETVQRSKKVQYPDYYVEDLDSEKIIDQWKDAGWPKHSPFLRNTEQGDPDQSEAEPKDEGSDENTPTHNDDPPSTDGSDEESRPNEYVPPSHYIPTDDDDETIREVAKQAGEVSIPDGETPLSASMSGAGQSSPETEVSPPTGDAMNPIGPEAEKESAPTVSQHEPAPVRTVPDQAKIEIPSDAGAGLSDSSANTSSGERNGGEQLPVSTVNQEVVAPEMLDTRTDAEAPETEEQSRIGKDSSTPGDQVSTTFQHDLQLLDNGQHLPAQEQASRIALEQHIGGQAVSVMETGAED